MWTLFFLIAVAFGSIVEPRRRLGAISYDHILSDEEKQGFVDRHNHWRNQAASGTFYNETKASQMPRVFWDSELAENSKKFSQFCVTQKSSSFGFNDLKYSHGENLYLSNVTRMNGASFAHEAVNSWGNQYLDYNPIDNSCADICGHYTQVVWENSIRIGCGVTECSDIDGNGVNGTIIVCQYWPPGNYPTSPYTFALGTTGESCANGVHGGSTGMHGTWTNLCNNKNDICGEFNRCSSDETCSSSEPLNGFNTSYACEMIPTSAPTSSPSIECSNIVIADGYEILNTQPTQNGMEENGNWKYCSDEEECNRWCWENQAAGCVGVTSDVNKNGGFYFPVTTIAENDREVVVGGRITFMECASVSPTLSPTTGTPSLTDMPSDAPTVQGYILSDDEKQGFVDRHNYWRNIAANGSLDGGAKASQMPQVYWDSELAQHSKSYSQVCDWHHSTDTVYDNLGYVYGENIFFSGVTGLNGTDLSTKAVDSWAQQHQYHDPHDHTCGEVCGHYTQIVWENTVRIGCGMTECPNIEGLGFGGTIIVCQYYPAGNYEGIPYIYALNNTGETCANGVHGSSTGMDGTWVALCNNKNEICGENNRCSSYEYCLAGNPLNGFNTSYDCQMMPTPTPTASPFAGCSYTVVAEGYEINNVLPSNHGMEENGTWKYCSDEHECILWCHVNEDAGCMGVSSHFEMNSRYYFPVDSIDESEWVEVAGGRITHMECLTLIPSSPPSGPACYYYIIAEGYEINTEVDDHIMLENGATKSCFSEYECARWCYANQDAGCVGVTSDVSGSEVYYPVTSIAESDRLMVEGGMILVMQCLSLSPSLIPTPPTTAQTTALPSLAPTNTPSIIVWALTLCCLTESELVDTVPSVAAVLGVPQEAVTLESWISVVTTTKRRQDELAGSWQLTYHIEVESSDIASEIAEAVSSAETISALEDQIEDDIPGSSVSVTESSATVSGFGEGRTKKGIEFWVLILIIAITLVLIMFAICCCIRRRRRTRKEKKAMFVENELFTTTEDGQKIVKTPPGESTDVHEDDGDAGPKTEDNISLATPTSVDEQLLAPVSGEAQLIKSASTRYKI